MEDWVWQSSLPFVSCVDDPCGKDDKQLYVTIYYGDGSVPK
jgi:hypothetical protein